MTRPEPRSGSRPIALASIAVTLVLALAAIVWLARSDSRLDEPAPPIARGDPPARAATRAPPAAAAALLAPRRAAVTLPGPDEPRSLAPADAPPPAPAEPADASPTPAAEAPRRLAIRGRIVTVEEAAARGSAPRPRAGSQPGPAGAAAPPADPLALPPYGRLVVRARPVGSAEERHAVAELGGGFEAAVPAPGAYEVAAEGVGGASAWVVVEVDAEGGHPPVELVLAPFRALAGRVLDRAGQPVENAEVFIASEGEAPRRLRPGSMLAFTDDEGRFSVEVEDDLYRVRARVGAEASGVARGVAPGGPPIDLVLGEGPLPARIRGRFADERGEPLAGVALTIEPASGGEAPMDLPIGTSGLVALDGLTPGAWTLAFPEPTRPGGPPMARVWVREVVLEPGADLDLGFDAEVPRGAIAGRALGALAGEPVHLLAVPAEPSTASFGLRVAVEADARGAFAIAAVPVGRYVLTADGGPVAGQVTVDVEPERESFVEVLLDAR